MKTILLIEDNEEILENMAEILTLANYLVLLARDGKQGITKAMETIPDLILCDIMMPELDGFAVLHLLQKHDKTAHIPFVFITAMAERSEIRKGMELGADDYITKPFSGTELLNAVETRLKKISSQVSSISVPEIREDGASLNMDQFFESKQDSATYLKKQTVYKEGQHAFRLYKVQRGKIKTFKINDVGKELITGIYQAGDFFGYNAILEGTLFRENAEALELSEIVSISKESFDIMIINPQVKNKFIKLLAGNVREKEEQLLGQAYNSLRKKVAEALMMLQHKYTVDPEGPTTIRMSRENMAALAGTAKESLIRTLGDFRDEGLIEMMGTDIILLQQEKLSSLYN